MIIHTSQEKRNKIERKKHVNPLKVELPICLGLFLSPNKMKIFPYFWILIESLFPTNSQDLVIIKEKKTRMLQFRCKKKKNISRYKLTSTPS